MLSSRYFIDLTQPEIAAQFRKNPLVILPAGSVEQHGPHLPAGTDIFRGECDRPRRRGTHGRACLTWGPAWRDAVSHAVRGHYFAYTRYLYAPGLRNLRLDGEPWREVLAHSQLA